MKNLIIKELVPYLPYFLKVQDENGRIGIFCGFDFNGQPVRFMNYTIAYNWKVEPDSQDIDWLVFNDAETISRCKPILKPLSDITNDQLKTLSRLQRGGYIADGIKLLIENNPLNAKYKVVEKLFEWHFDVFRLIKKGCAIDINTIQS